MIRFLAVLAVLANLLGAVVTHAATPQEAAAVTMVCQFSQPECPAVDSAQLEAVPPDTVCPIHAPACAEPGRILYVPQAVHNPALTDTDELFLMFAKEGVHVGQFAAGQSFNGRDCVPFETAGHVQLVAAWGWLWNGQPPNIAYNAMEEAAAMDTAGGLAGNVAYTCGLLFGGWHV